MVDDRFVFCKGTTFSANFKQLCIEGEVVRTHNKKINVIFKNRALMGLMLIRQIWHTSKQSSIRLKLMQTIKESSSEPVVVLLSCLFVLPDTT